MPGIIPVPNSMYCLFYKEQEIPGRIHVANFPTVQTCSYTNVVFLKLYFGNIRVEHNSKM
jgi:hypothetical protein